MLILRHTDVDGTAGVKQVMHSSHVYDAAPSRWRELDAELGERSSHVVLRSVIPNEIDCLCQGTEGLVSLLCVNT